MNSGPSFSLCNEVISQLSFDQQCAFVSSAGLQGIELAPEHTWNDPRNVSNSEITFVRECLDEYNLKFAGMHWLLAGTGDFQIFHPNEVGFKETWDYLIYLSEISGALGGGAMVLGSPVQRSRNGLDPDSAIKVFIESLRGIIPSLEKNNSKLLIEALPASHTDFINTISESVDLSQKIASLQVSSMFDFHNTEDETDSFLSLFRTNLNYIQHVHINDYDGRFPRAESIIEHVRSFWQLKPEIWYSFEIFEVFENYDLLKEEISKFLKSFTKMNSIKNL